MPFAFIPEYPDMTRNNGCFTCAVQRRTTVEYRGGGERLIDLGQEVDSTVDQNGYPIMMDTHAIICETCVRELASMVNMVDQGFGPYHGMAQKVASLENENARLKAVVGSLRNVKDLMGQRG